MSNITATTRDPKENLATIRTNGMVPAVFYGAGKSTTHISISQKEFTKVFKEAGETTTVVVTLGNDKVNALIHEVQFDPIRGTPLHVDFLVVDMNKPIEVAVPLEFVGIAPGAKSGAGTLVKVMHELEIRALPKDVPHMIEVDLSKLVTLEDQILVSDLKLGSGVTAIPGAEEVIAALAAQVEESLESTPVDISAIEVEKKGKKEEESPAAE